MSDEASIVDFQAPFDPTAFTTITGAQLLQLIVAAQPYVDKGLVVATEDDSGTPLPPDAGAVTKFQKYLWLRIVPLTSTLVLYAWNPNATNNIAYSDGSGTTILSHWIPVISSSIPPGSITGSLIAANTILPGNINLSVLATALGFNPSTTVTTSTTPATGDITGNFASGFTILADKILTALIADLAVTGAKIAAATIDYTKLIGDGTAGDMLKSTGTPAIAPVWFTPLQITTGLANPNSGGSDDNKFLAVNSGAAGTFKYVSGTTVGIGRLVQSISKASTAADSTATVIPYDATIPQITEGKEYITVTITPTSATNLLKISFTCFLGNSSDGDRSIIALFQDATANALNATTVETPDGAGDACGLTLRHIMLAGTTSAITFRIRFGPSANTGYINQSSAAALFGAAAVSFLTVEEYVGTLS